MNTDGKLGKASLETNSLVRRRRRWRTLMYVHTMVRDHGHIAFTLKTSGKIRDRDGHGHGCEMSARYYGPEL